MLTGPDSPVGVFDSGVGGLSVLAEIRRRLPDEDLLYVADSAHVPYGIKSREFIRERAFVLTRFLAERGAKAVVIACNTATAAAVAELRAHFDLPIVAMEPAVKPASLATRSGVVGVLATEGTLASTRFAALVDRFANGVEIITQPCPGLVEQVERGDLDGAETRRLLETYAVPLMERRADTLILGCTHYPFLKEALVRLAGPEVRLIDTGEAVARQLERRLLDAGLARRDNASPTTDIWTSGEPERLKIIIRQLWSDPARIQALPNVELDP